MIETETHHSLIKEGKQWETCYSSVHLKDAKTRPQ